jgi:hypothetical protein
LQRSSAFVGKLALENESLKEGSATVVRRQARLCPSSSGPVKSQSVRDGRPMGLARWVHSTAHTRNAASIQSSLDSLHARQLAWTPRLPQKLRLFRGLI